MKKLFSFIVLLAVIFFVADIALADIWPREDGTKPDYVNVTSTNNDSVMVSRPCYVYAVTLQPTAANGSVDLIDSTTAGTAISPSNTLVELSEATANDAKRYVFDPPLKATTGVLSDVTNANVVVEYR